MNPIQPHSKKSITVSDDLMKNVVAALNTKDKPTMASAIFGNPCDFKPPGGTEPIKAAGRDCKWPNTMTMKEASSNGFIKEARSCGFGVYQSQDLDGGLGSIWYMEKDADSGEQFLVKQTDNAGDVVRRAKAMKRKAEPILKLNDIAWTQEPKEGVSAERWVGDGADGQYVAHLSDTHAKIMAPGKEGHTVYDFSNSGEVKDFAYKYWNLGVPSYAGESGDEDEAVPGEIQNDLNQEQGNEDWAAEQGVSTSPGTDPAADLMIGANLKGRFVRQVIK